MQQNISKKISFILILILTFISLINLSDKLIVQAQDCSSVGDICCTDDDNNQYCENNLVCILDTCQPCLEDSVECYLGPDAQTNLCENCCNNWYCTWAGCWCGIDPSGEGCYCLPNTNCSYGCTWSDQPIDSLTLCNPDNCENEEGGYTGLNCYPDEICDIDGNCEPCSNCVQPAPWHAYCEDEEKYLTDPFCDDDHINTAIGCIPITDGNAFVEWLFPKLLGIMGGIAFLLMLYGGFLIITASGNPEKIQAGQETITSAIAGLIFAIFSLFILQLIGIDILRIPGLGSP